MRMVYCTHNYKKRGTDKRDSVRTSRGQGVSTASSLVYVLDIYTQDHLRASHKLFFLEVKAVWMFGFLESWDC